MLSRIKNTLRTRKQDTRKSTGDRTTDTAIQAAHTVRNIDQEVSCTDTLVKASFHTIGTSGSVMNVAGDLHMYNGDSAIGTS